MRITPLEIRQKSFEKHFRGYDKDEVNAFLVTLSQEWERILDENKELRIKLEASEREVTKLREVEGSLYKTLKTAEDTGANVIEQARQAAELHLREIQLKAEAVLNEAKMKAKNTLEEADMRARSILTEMEERLKSLTDNYKRLESSREDLLSELKRLASDILDRVGRAQNVSKEFNPDKYFAHARLETKSAIFPAVESPVVEKAPEPSPEPEPTVVVEKHVTAESQQKKYPRSFFDEIG